MKVPGFKLLLILIGISALTLTSCKKKSNAMDDSISAQDAATVTNAVSYTSDDAGAAAGQVSSYKSLSAYGGFNNANGNLLVGASITDTSSSSGIVISYDGTTPCNGIIRSGSVTITNTGGIPWHEPGAQLTVTYNNLVINDQKSGNTYTLNGIHIVTNELGGLAWQVVAGISQNTTVVHRIQTPSTGGTGTGGMTISFPGGSQRTWTVDRTRSWSSSVSGSVNTITVSVYSQAAGGVTESGTNRYGEAFTNTIPTTSPITANNNTSCTWMPYTGTFTHQISNRTATVQFGTNASGDPIGSPTTCGLGYYITYTNGSTTRYRFVQYW